MICEENIKLTFKNLVSPEKAANNSLKLASPCHPSIESSIESLAQLQQRQHSSSEPTHERSLSRPLSASLSNKCINNEKFSLFFLEKNSRIQARCYINNFCPLWMAKIWVLWITSCCQLWPCSLLAYLRTICITTLCSNRFLKIFLKGNSIFYDKWGLSSFNILKNKH